VADLPGCFRTRLVQYSGPTWQQVSPRRLPYRACVIGRPKGERNERSLLRGREQRDPQSPPLAGGQARPGPSTDAPEVWRPCGVALPSRPKVFFTQAEEPSIRHGGRSHATNIAR
jgi:hypothetical protein